MDTIEKQQTWVPGQASIAVFDHLSGPSIGLETLLFRKELDIYLDDNRFVRVVGPNKSRDGQPPEGEPIARLQRSDNSFQLEALNDSEIWINGRKTESAELHHNDIVEFGEKGPLSRFRLLNASTHKRRYFSQICDDSWAYLKTSRRPVLSRIRNTLGRGMIRLAAGSTLLFRATVIITLILLAIVTYQQYTTNQLQQLALTESSSKIETFSRTLSRAREEALTPNDLAELKELFARDLSASSSRLDALEQQTAATENMAHYPAGLCFLIAVGA